MCKQYICTHTRFIHDVLLNCAVRNHQMNDVTPMLCILNTALNFTTVHGTRHAAIAFKHRQVDTLVSL